VALSSRRRSLPAANSLDWTGQTGCLTRALEDDVVANLTFENEQLNGLLRITIEEGSRTLPLRSG